MATEYIYPEYVQNDGTVMRHYLCDTQADLPTSRPVGTVAYVKETDSFWSVATDNQWHEPASGGGGAHPNLATHDSMGLATQAELDDGLALKEDAHSHPYEASGAVTTHEQAANPHATYLTQAEGDGLYVHSHPYASTSHNHDASYSAVGHSHGGGSQAFPVGSIYISVDSTNPATTLGYGSWAAFATGRTLVGLDSGDADFDTAQETGGAKTHTLIQAEMPNHTHTQQRHSTTTGALQGITTAPDTSSSNPVNMGPSTGGAGSGGAHNNLQPYIVVYMWRRTG